MVLHVFRKKSNLKEILKEISGTRETSRIKEYGNTH